MCIRDSLYRFEFIRGCTLPHNNAYRKITKSETTQIILDNFFMTFSGNTCLIATHVWSKFYAIILNRKTTKQYLSKMDYPCKKIYT